MITGSLTPLEEFQSLRDFGRVIARIDPPSFPLSWSDDGETEITLFQQSMKILDQFWLSHSQITKNHAQHGEWRYFRNQMVGKWTLQVLQTMLLLTAISSCKIGVSAYDWVEEHFTPVIIRFANVDVLGLLSNHALKKSENETIADLPLWSVDRLMTPNYAMDSHLQTLMIVSDRDNGPIGTDLLLVEPRSRAPVGLLPDFLALSKTPEETSERISLLYGDLVQDVGARYKFVRVVSLRDIVV